MAKKCDTLFDAVCDKSLFPNFEKMNLRYLSKIQLINAVDKTFITWPFHVLVVAPSSIPNHLLVTS